ncbi:nucleotidyltransferase domain-containing protein [Candidatus Pacearchaeota archaeon]|nr:nucleotidyltransferase domain-containing protein [Candidatus Pacearchaeota archaeon]
MDFAEKAYRKFDKLLKSVILFGSTAKGTNTAESDIDIILIVDDAMIKFDEALVLWYREELGKIIQSSPYKKELHINTIRLTTWWNDLLKGDPVVLNVIRYGEPIIDFGGFFDPLKILLEDGKIKPTPESMYTMLNRVPMHIVKSKLAEMSAIEGCYWAMVESAQSLLMAINITPPSPEHIPVMLREHFVDKNLLKNYYVNNFKDVYDLHRQIIHGEIKDIDGKIIDEMQSKAEDFFKTCVGIINSIIK